MGEIKIKRNYTFWRHPVRWFKEIRLMQNINAFANYEWEHGGKEKCMQATKDFITSGAIPDFYKYRKY